MDEMDNYLNSSLKSYFKEITEVEGFLISVEGFIKLSHYQLSKTRKETDMINALVTTYRDLSKSTEGPNLYTPEFCHKLTVSGFKKNIALIVSRECCFALSQAYEIFETYLKRTLGLFLFNNPSFISLLNKKNTPIPNNQQGYAGFVDDLLRQSKNNKKLLWVLRQVSPFYSKHEVFNIWSFNLANWYDLLSEIRHAIVHARQELTERVRTNIIQNQNIKIFERYYNAENSLTHSVIFTDRVRTAEQIHLMNSFAYLIFKALSIEEGMDTTYQV